MNFYFKKKELLRAVNVFLIIKSQKYNFFRKKVTVNLRIRFFNVKKR